MTLTLYGVTSDGTSVPIEVTDDGKLVIDTSGVSDYVKQGDDVEFGTGEFTGNVQSGGSPESGAAEGVLLKKNGRVEQLLIKTKLQFGAGIRLVQLMQPLK